MSTPLSKSILEDDDDEQDYIPVGVLQVSSFRQPPANLGHLQTQLPPNEDLVNQTSSYNQSQGEVSLSPSLQTNLNHPQFEQLGFGELEQGHSRPRNNEGIEYKTQAHQQDTQSQKNAHFQSLEKEGKQDHLPQYKLLLQLMQQQQRAQAQAQGVNNDQGNQSQLQTKIKTSSSSVQSNSASENQRQVQKLSREDLNSNVPLESQNQLLKILTLAQREQQAGLKHRQNFVADNRVNSNCDVSSNTPQGSVVKQNFRHVERDKPLLSKSALKIDISPSFQHIPKSPNEYLPHQSPTSAPSSSYHVSHPNMNYQHPEITKRLNSPVSPGRQSTSPRQTVSPRHTGGSPRLISSSPCQFISPKQPVSPRGSATNSRKSQPSSPQPFHHPPSPKVQSGFSWQPQQPPSPSSPVVSSRRSSATSNSQDLPSPVSQFLNPLSSSTALTHEATAENIHHHPSRFQPIPITRLTTLSGGVVHHQAPESSSWCETSLSSAITSINPLPESSASSLSQTAAMSQPKPQFSTNSSDTFVISHSPQLEIKDSDASNNLAEFITPVPSSQNSLVKKGNESITQSMSCDADRMSQFEGNQYAQLGPSDLIPVSQNNGSSDIEEKPTQSIPQILCDESVEKDKCDTVGNEIEPKNGETEGQDVGGCDEKVITKPGRNFKDPFKNSDVPQAKSKSIATKDDHDILAEENLSDSQSREGNRLDSSANPKTRETSSKRLRKPKVPFEDSGSAAGKVKKIENRQDKVSHERNAIKSEKGHNRKQAQSSSVHKQSVLTRSGLRHKGNSTNKMIKLSDGRDSRGQVVKRAVRGSDLKMKSNRYMISRRVNKRSKETEKKQKQRISYTTVKESEKALRNDNRNIKESKQDQKKGNEVATSQVKRRNEKDNKDQKELRKGNENVPDQTKETKVDQKKINESNKERRRGSDASSKRLDKELKQNLSKDSVSTADSEINTRCSTRRTTKQSGPVEDKSKKSNPSNSRSRSRTREPSNDSKPVQHERLNTRGLKVQESPTASNERVATRASKSIEPTKESKSLPNGKIITQDSKIQDLHVEPGNSAANSRVLTRGSKTHESSSSESNSGPKEKASKGLQSHESSNLTSNDRVVTRGSKVEEISKASGDSTPTERVSTRSSKISSQVPITPEKAVTRGMTTRHSDVVKNVSKRPLESTHTPSSLPKKRAKSIDGDASLENEVAKSSDSRYTRSKSGSLKVKHDFKNNDEDDEYNAEEDEEISSDDGVLPTTTRSGRITQVPKRKMSMRLRREASKRKYNIEEESISDESRDSDDDSDSVNESDQSENERTSDTESEKSREIRCSSKGDKKLEALSAPTLTSDMKKSDSTNVDLSKLIGFKLVPLTPEEMAGTPGKDSILPLDGFIIPGRNCILLPAHFTQYMKTEKEIGTRSMQSSTASISQAPTRVLATPRPISSTTELSGMKSATSAFNTPMLSLATSDPPSSSSASLYGSHHHHYHAGLKNQSIVPSAPTPPPVISLSSSTSSSTRIAPSVSSSNPWNSPSLPTPPPSVSSSSSHSSSSWNPVANLQPWMSDGSTPGTTAWNNEATNSEGWRGNNTTNNSNNTYLPKGSYGDGGLGLNTEVLPMHESAPQRLHHQDLPSSGQDPLYINDRVSSSSPPVEAVLFRDSSNLSPSGYNIALPGLGQQDISYLESKLQQEMDMSSMLLSEVPYEDEIHEPAAAVHHGIPVCSVNLDDADVAGRLSNVTPTLHLPGSSRGLENANMSNMQSSQQQHQQHQQQHHNEQQEQHLQQHQQLQEQPLPQKKQPTSFLEELMSEPRVEAAGTMSSVIQKEMNKADEASPNIKGNTGEKSLVNTKRHLYEVIIKDDKKYGKCRVCNGSFSLSSIYRHLKKHEDPSAGIFCSICGKKYSQKHNLTTHMKRVHNVGADSHGVSQEEETKKESLQQIVKPEQNDSLDSVSVDKPIVPLSSTESDSQIDTKEGSDTKDGKKKPRKRSTDRKYIKDGLVYELMPESPNPMDTRSRRRTQRLVERVRRMKAKKKLETGKNAHGITYNLSKLDDDSTGDESDYESEDEEMNSSDEKVSSIVDNRDGYQINPEEVNAEEQIKDENEDLADETYVVKSKIIGDVSSSSDTITSVSTTTIVSSPNIKSNVEMKDENEFSQNKNDFNKSNIVGNKEGSDSASVFKTMEWENLKELMAGGEGVNEEVDGKDEVTSNPLTKEKYPCSLCSSILASKCSLFLHMKRHKSVKDKVCNYCGKGFITGQELRSHERTHTGERPYICEICKYTFAHQGSYQAHKKVHAKRGETEPFPPEKCYNEGIVQQPFRRKKRAKSDGVGSPSKDKEDSSVALVSDKKDDVSETVPENTYPGNLVQANNSNSSSGDMSKSDPMMRRRSLESSGLSQQQTFDQQQCIGGSEMRPPAWPAANPGAGGSWENRRHSMEQQPQQNIPHSSLSNVGPHRSPTTNFRDQSSPSLYSSSPNQYSSTVAESPMMSANIHHPPNQMTSSALPQQNKYPPQSSPSHNRPSTQQCYPPSHPHVPHNMNTMKSPTHDPSFPASSPNQLYSGSNLDDGRLFASPGPPPPTATLVHPRKQQHHQKQLPHPPQNFSPSQQFMFGSTSSHSSPNSYSQSIQQQQQQQQHKQQHQHQHYPHAQLQQQQQLGHSDEINTLINQYNIPPSSPFSGNTVPGAAPIQQTQQQRQQQRQHQHPSQYHNPHHSQGVPPQQQQKYLHQFHQSPGLQQQQQQQQQQQHHHHHQQQSQQQQQPTSGQQHSIQEFTPPPPYNPSQPKPPPPYPASYNEFYGGGQHTDESQPPQQTPRIQSPNMMHQHAAHQNFSPSYANPAHFPPSSSTVNRSSNQTANMENNAQSLSSPATNNTKPKNGNASYSQPAVRPPSGSQMNLPTSIHPSSPSINPQQQSYHHHLSPSQSSTPSPGYYHQGPSPSSSG